MYKQKFRTCIFMTQQLNVHIPVKGDADSIRHSPYVRKVECWSPLWNNKDIYYQHLRYKINMWQKLWVSIINLQIHLKILLLHAILKLADVIT